MKHILTLFTLAAFAFSASATEKIEGGFGLKLGDSFEPSGSRFLAEDADAFEFTPKVANPAFSTYVVFITPNSHQIYRILAISKPLESGTGFEQSNTILALIHRKYGIGPFRGANAISQGQRKVSVNNNGAGTPAFTFRLSYTDENLSTQASEERLDNKLKGANADGI